MPCKKYLQVRELRKNIPNLIYVFLYFTEHLRHPCDRVCHLGDEPMICKYRFEIELHSTLNKVSTHFKMCNFTEKFILTVFLQFQACYDCPSNISHCFLPHCVSGDGIERGIITINRYSAYNLKSPCQNLLF